MPLGPTEAAESRKAVFEERATVDILPIPFEVSEEEILEDLFFPNPPFVNGVDRGESSE